VRLICSLRYDMDVEPGTLPVVLSLMDQLYDTRRRLNALGAAVAAQDSAVREAILRLIGERG
jgi:chaperone modulatory protein CbpM